MATSFGTSSIIRSIAALAIVFTLYALGRAFVSEINLIGLPPCQETSDLFRAAWWALPVAIVVGIVAQASAIRRPSLVTLVVALSIPAASWLLHDQAARWDNAKQKECRARPVEQAMTFCRANPRFYQQGKSKYGNVTMTLIAPGETDAAWDCLAKWNMWNGSVSFKVDESVYEAYRKAYQGK